MFESIDRVVTRGELEAAISDLIVKFELEYFGRGPQQIRTHLIGDMLLVRMSGVLTPSELRLVRGANSAAATVLL
ncbi:Na-translocating system protein MpsC family protein, partial [Schlesneria sp.]